MEAEKTQSNYLHNSRVVSEVISPISLGMEPVKACPSNGFGDDMLRVSKWYCEDTTDIIVNGSRIIVNSITYTNQDSQGRLSVQSHWELYQ